jgi:hypothetical protein
MNPFPPSDNKERLLTAVLEELRTIREILDRLLIVALEKPARQEPGRRRPR